MSFVDMCVCIYVFFFFKQKTAYEMRISDWSSDVCSSDLAVEAADEELALGHQQHALPIGLHGLARRRVQPAEAAPVENCRLGRIAEEIGRASCRERVCQYV